MNYKQAQSLKTGDIVHYIGRGGCQSSKTKPAVVVRYRVNGAVKTWKKDPYRVQVPVKHGLYHFGYINNDNLTEWHLESECPLREGKLPGQEVEAELVDLEV